MLSGAIASCIARTASKSSGQASRISTVVPSARSAYTWSVSCAVFIDVSLAENRAGDLGPEELALVLPVRVPPPAGPEHRGDGDPAEARFGLDADAERIPAERRAAGVAPAVHPHFGEPAVPGDPELGGLGVVAELPGGDGRVGVLAPAPRGVPVCGRDQRDLPGPGPEPVVAGHRQAGQPGGGRPDVSVGRDQDLVGGERPPPAELDLAVHGQLGAAPQRRPRGDRVAEPAPGGLGESMVAAGSKVSATAVAAVMAQNTCYLRTRGPRRPGRCPGS